VRVACILNFPATGNQRRRQNAAKDRRQIESIFLKHGALLVLFVMNVVTGTNLTAGTLRTSVRLWLTF
jgi:hypothetical protein